MKILQNLNPRQREAVLHGEGLAAFDDHGAVHAALRDQAPLSVDPEVFRVDARRVISVGRDAVPLRRGAYDIGGIRKFGL